MKIENMEKQFSVLNSKLHKLIGLQEHYISEKVSLLQNIQNNSDYLEKKDDVQYCLHELQHRTQAKTKTIYEQLLSSLIKDIMPNNDESAEVKLNTGVRNNRTTLSVDVLNSDGFSRDVYLDKGGSIENIVAMGLRFIALSRTSNRRFLILDEADSWLRSDYIPDFAEVLCQLSKKIGIQVVYISHHSVDYFKGKAKIINLTRQDGKVVSEELGDDEADFDSIEDEEVADLMDGVGIKYLRLVNFKQHENTLINLSPNVTIITGDNDIGKTTVLQAIEAVNKNAGREGLIRDNQPYCRVEVGLEDDISVNWTHRRKAQKKSSYSLVDDKGDVIKESHGAELPDWIHEYLSMALYKDFDLHVGDQHSASFILDKNISTHRRAEILSLGKEANKVQQMITLHGEKVTLKKKELNQDKKKLNEVKNKLAVLRTLEPVIDEMQKIENFIYNNSRMLSDLDSLSLIAKKLLVINSAIENLISVESLERIEIIPDVSDLKSMEDIALRYSSISTRIKSLSSIENTAKIEEIEFSDNIHIHDLLIKLGSLNLKIEKMSELSSLERIPMNIENEDLELNRLCVSLGKVNSKINTIENTINNNFSPIDIPAESDSLLSQLELLGTSISSKQRAIEKLSKEISEQNILIQSTNNEISVIQKSFNGVCPTCDGLLNKGVHTHA